MNSPVKSKAEALKRLKRYWLNTCGSCYLDHLHGLISEYSEDHKNFEALAREVEFSESVYDEFAEWTKLPRVKRKLQKMLHKAALESQESDN